MFFPCLLQYCVVFHLSSFTYNALEHIAEKNESMRNCEFQSTETDVLWNFSANWLFRTSRQNNIHAFDEKIESKQALPTHTHISIERKREMINLLKGWSRKWSGYYIIYDNELIKILPRGLGCNVKLGQNSGGKWAIEMAIVREMEKVESRGREVGRVRNIGVLMPNAWNVLLNWKNSECMCGYTQEPLLFDKTIYCRGGE